MEPTEGKIVPIYLGDYVVENIAPTGSITINVGGNVRITIHARVRHQVKLGDKLPLYTRIPLCPPSLNTSPTNLLNS